MRVAVSLMSDSAVTASARADAALGSDGDVSIADRALLAASRSAVRYVVISSSRRSMRPGVAVVDRGHERGRRGLQPLCQFGFDEPRDASGRGAEDRVGQFGGGHAGDPVRQFVCLVDDEQSVFGKHRGVGDGVDGQQRVVGDDDVGVPRRVACLLREAVGAERAARRADAFPGRDADLCPRPVRHAGCELVAVAGVGVRRPGGQALARRARARSMPPRRTVPPAVDHPAPPPSRCESCSGTGSFRAP